MCVLAAQRLAIDALELLVCSTGIIGHALPMDEIQRGVSQIEFGRGVKADERFARHHDDGHAPEVWRDKAAWPRRAKCLVKDTLLEP